MTGENANAARIEERLSGWRHPATLLGAALLTLLAAQVGWVVLSQRPVEYDAAWYLETALSLKRLLGEHGWTAYLEGARSAFKFKAPGVSMAAALAMAVGGESVGVATSVSLAAWLLAAGYLYVLSRRFLTAGSAALAALLASVMPMAFSMARSLLVEASLTAVVVAFLFHAAASEGLRRPGHVLALAGWGAAGLMVKATFPGYVVVPALLLTLMPGGATRTPWARIVAIWAAIAAVAAGVAAWLWYADNWQTTLEFVRSAGFGPLADDYMTPISIYLASALLHAASPWSVASLVGLAVAVVVRRPASINWRAVTLAAAWLVPMALLLTSSSNRTVRFLAALLPALALAISALAEPWLRRGWRTATLVVAVLAAPPLAWFAVATVPTRLAGPARGWVEAPWLGRSVWYEGPPDGRPWPNASVVAAAARAIGGHQPAVLRLNVDLPELNHNNIKLEALLQHTAVEPAQIDQRSPEGALVTAFDGEFLLLQVGGVVANDFVNLQRDVVAREAASGRHPYREVGRFDLPGARQVALLERVCEVGPEDEAGPPLAKLERGVELIALDVARPAKGLVSVRSRYRVRDGSHPMLSAVIELSDGTGRRLGAGEHPLCRRALRPWPAGTVVEDTFFLPAWSVAPGVALRLGLRNLRTGTRLRVDHIRAGLAVAGGGVEFSPLAARLIPVER